MEVKGAAYAINEIIDFIQAGIPGAVKQVASGVHTFANNGDATISTGITVDPNKTIVLINSGGYNSESPSSAVNAFHSVLVAKTATTITLSASVMGNYKLRASWQVIEFY